jgi:hypothetical protein
MELSVEEWDALVDAGELVAWTKDEADELKWEVQRLRTLKGGPTRPPVHKGPEMRHAIAAIMAYKLKNPPRRKPIVTPGSGQSWRG